MVGETFNYDVNASDNDVVESYIINDTINFQVDATNGFITNALDLAVGIYNLEIIAEDPSGNNLTAIIKITVIDSESPSWDENPTDQTLLVGETFYYHMKASDNIAIDTYWLNDTSTFQIYSNGLITNKTNLLIGIYSIEIHVNDTSGNEIMAKITIEVEDDTTEDDNINGIPGYSGTIITLTMFIMGFGLITLQKKKRVIIC